MAYEIIQTISISLLTQKSKRYHIEIMKINAVLFVVLQTFQLTSFQYLLEISERANTLIGCFWLRNYQTLSTSGNHFRCRKFKKLFIGIFVWWHWLTCCHLGVFFFYAETFQWDKFRDVLVFVMGNMNHINTHTHAQNTHTNARQKKTIETHEICQGIWTDKTWKTNKGKNRYWINSIFCKVKYVCVVRVYL